MVPVVLQVLQKAVPLPLVVLMVLWLAAVRALAAAVSAVPTVQAVPAQIVAAVVQRKVAVKAVALAPLVVTGCGSRLLDSQCQDLLVEQRERQWRP